MAVGIEWYELGRGGGGGHVKIEYAGAVLVRSMFRSEFRGITKTVD